MKDKDIFQAEKIRDRIFKAEQYTTSIRAAEVKELTELTQLQNSLKEVSKQEGRRNWKNIRQQQQGLAGPSTRFKDIKRVF